MNDPHPPSTRRPMGITRREVILGGVALAALAACGDDATQGSPSPSTTSVASGPTSTTPPSTTAAGPRKVTHQFGTFDIPGDPKRVVALDGRPSFEHVLALGFTPVAVGQDALVDGKLASFIKFDIKDVPLLMPNNVNFESLLTLKPDLIVGRNFNIESQLDKLVKVAPVLPIQFDDPWRKQLDQLAGWLGREKTTAGVLAEYDAKAAAIRTRHKSKIASTKVGIVQWSPEKSLFDSLQTSSYVHHQTLTDLGGVHSTFLTDLLTGPSKGVLSIENVDKLNDLDAILVIHFAFDAGQKSLKEQPLWQTVSAVKKGHVVESDFRINYGGVYAAMRCLDVLDQLYATIV